MNELQMEEYPDAPLTLGALLARGDGPFDGLARAQREALFAIGWDREHPPTWSAWFEVLEWMELALVTAREASAQGSRMLTDADIAAALQPPWPTSHRDYSALRAFKWDASSPPAGNAWLYVRRGIGGGRDYAELCAVRRRARLAGAPVPDRMPAAEASPRPRKPPRG
jgi:hypothetical protein